MENFKIFLKKLIPLRLIQIYRKQLNTMAKSKFIGMTPEETFNEIYETNTWKGNTSISGPGSEEAQTKTIVEAINLLIDDLKIDSMLDLPCGDFVWMKKVKLQNIKYLGADIVESLIQSNLKKYNSKNNIRFKVLDLINDPLPKCDIIINRDCLVHLSFNDIYKSLQNIKQSGCGYLLTTTFIKHNVNYDITTGDWRTINLQSSPFNFSIPIMVINENCTEGNGENIDKSLALWKISEIELPRESY